MTAASSPTLADFQNWLIASITLPACVEPNSIDAAILPSRQQTAAERLGVYQHAYIARLLDVLRELFPCTRFAVGDELFDQFAAGYLRRFPPHSFTLGRLADHWVHYLDETRPPDADWGGFIVEIATLEQAIDRIFDGPGPENLPAFALPASPSDLRLTLVPGCELHAFQFPVSTYFTDWKAGRNPAWPDRREQHLALLRRHYIVRRHDLTRDQFQLLWALSQGHSLTESLSTLPTAAPADIHTWFTHWASVGFFASAIPS